MSVAKAVEGINEELEWFKARPDFGSFEAYDAGFVRGMEHALEKVQSLVVPEPRTVGASDG